MSGSGRRSVFAVSVRASLAAMFVLGSLNIAPSRQAGEALKPGSRGATAPMIGTNFTHFPVTACNLVGAGVIDSYDQPGVRSQVRSALLKTREAGIVALRTIIWHEHDLRGQQWGVVQSGRPALTHRVRRNLERYASDVRRAGFDRLTVAMAPMGRNDPRSPRYDPVLLEENWRVLVAVRTAVRRFGPRDVRMDLLHEAASEPEPSALLQSQILPYLRLLWGRYVATFGNRDAAVSVVAHSGSQRDALVLEALVDALSDEGRPLPRWFDVHVSYEPARIGVSLRAIDAMLDRRELAQPLVIGEAAYDDRRSAEAIRTMIPTLDRRVDEVTEWPLTADRPCKDISVSPPYRADAYIDALTHPRRLGRAGSFHLGRAAGCVTPMRRTPDRSF